MGLIGSMLAIFGGIMAMMAYFCCPVFLVPLSSLALSIPAWIMGQNDLAAMKAGEMDPSGRETTMVGMIAGIVGTSVIALGTLLVVAVIIIYAIFVGFAIATEGSQ